MDTLFLRQSGKKKNYSGGAYYYAVETSGESGVFYSHAMIGGAIQSGRNVEFKNIDQDEQDKLFIAIIHSKETASNNDLFRVDRFKPGNVKLLNRIIKHGGAVEYAKHLEKQLNIKG